MEFCAKSSVAAMTLCGLRTVIGDDRSEHHVEPGDDAILRRVTATNETEEYGESRRKIREQGNGNALLRNNAEIRKSSRDRSTRHWRMF